MATSVSGEIWSDLYYLYMGIALVVGALVVGWLTYNLIKFRSRPGMPRPADAPRPGVIPVERGHPIWGWAMALGIAGIMLGLAFGTIDALGVVETPPDDEDRLELDVVGFQFGWKVNYTGVGGVPFQKINEWTVPVDTPVVMDVTSQDVWHNLAFPEYRVRIDAIPGEVTHIWFEAFEEETVEPVCVVICGTGHALMKSTMHVVSMPEYEAWLAAESERAYASLQKSFADGTRGTLLNVTFDGAALEANRQTVRAGLPVVLNLTNEAASPVQFTLTVDGQTRTVTAQPDEIGRLYVVAPQTGALRLAANGATAEFQVVS